MNTILVLGGYGGFGARLSRRLAAGGNLVLVAGRHLDRAKNFCAGVPHCSPVEADRNGDISAVLARYRPALVIDAAGPFQGSNYHVPKTCIAAGVHYLDLADGREFVGGIRRLDSEARRAGVTVLAGASSVPALSGAAARHLAEGMDTIAAIEISISASNRAAAGRSVATAILSYVGKPFHLWRGKRLTTGFGWQEMHVEPFELRDRTSLGRRLVALADVPDLDLLPARMPGRPAVSFRAGTELAFQNRALWLASWLVRWHWLGSLRGLARSLLFLQRLTRRWGSDRSGMVVRLFGVRSARRIERRWTLIASDGDGSEIPTLAAAILAGRIDAGGFEPGARDAGAALNLGDFDASFSVLSIRHETREIQQDEALYARIMGNRFAQLAPAVATMHSVLRDGGATGRAIVTRGSNPVAGLVAAIMRFPPAGEHALHVHFSERDGVEHWTRDFSGRRFSSRFSQLGPHLVEQFGPLRFRFELPSDGNGLRMTMRAWSCAGVPLPLALAPRSNAREWEEDGRFQFDVPIAMPLIGELVHYRGWLEPIEP